jgi:hypothetical protein
MGSDLLLHIEQTRGPKKDYGKNLYNLKMNLRVYVSIIMDFQLLVNTLIANL